MGVIRKLSKELKLAKCLPLRMYVGMWFFAFMVAIGIMTVGILQKTSKLDTTTDTEKEIGLVLAIIGGILLAISGFRFVILFYKYSIICSEMLVGEMILTMMFD